MIAAIELTGPRGGRHRAAVGNPFLDATAVRRGDDGCYRADLDPRWNLRPLPQGGVVTAAAVRAMAAELDSPDLRPRTLHTTFVAQVADGPLVIDVDVLRRGRTMSHARAEVRNADADRGHVTTCVFGATRPGFDFTDLEPPRDLPHPDECVSFRDPPPPDFPAFPPMPFWDEIVDARNVIGHPPWEPYEPDRAERAMWLRFDDPPLLDDGRLDPLALIVFADVMPGAAGEKLGPPERMWFAPSVDLTVHLLDDCRSSWVLAHNRCRYSGDGYASADMALWDCGSDTTSTPRLVAYGTQIFFYVFMD